MANCRYCGHRINFISTRNGKLMPVDPEPVGVSVDSGASSSFVLSDGSVVHGTRVPVNSAFGVKGYVSHFATCTKRPK